MSGITICPVAEAKELFVFLPVFTGGTGGGEPFRLVVECFECFSVFLDFETFWGISFSSRSELESDESDDADLVLIQKGLLYFCTFGCDISLKQKYK